MRVSSAIGSTHWQLAVGRLTTPQQPSLSPTLAPLLKNVRVLDSLPYKITLLDAEAVPRITAGLSHARV